MKLWTLLSLGDVDYDGFDGFVVRAQTENAARAYAAAASTHVDNVGNMWYDPKRTACTRLKVSSGSEGVVFDSYNAG